MVKRRSEWLELGASEHGLKAALELHGEHTRCRTWWRLLGNAMGGGESPGDSRGLEPRKRACIHA